MALDTMTLRIRRTWVKLTGVSQGFYLQRVSGANVYYLYSPTPPKKNEIGHRYVNFNDPTPLVGGDVYVRSDGVSIIGVTPYIVTDRAGDDALDYIGDLGQLPTSNKQTLVGAIQEIYSSGGGSGGGGNTIYYEVEVTALMVANKSLTLPDNPVPSSLRLNVYTGVLQRLNVDYTLTGDVVAWDSLGFELLIEEGMVLSFSYHT